MNPLALAARHGAWVLVLGLVAGLVLPGPAMVMQPWLPLMVVVLLFVSVLRIEPRELLGSLLDLPRVAMLVLLMQLALPLFILAIAALGGWLGAPVITALTLMSAAPSIVGSGNIALLMGVPPGAAVRLTVAGSVLLPVTVLPIFWLLPALGDIGTVLFAALRLIVIIAIGTGAALLVRLTILRHPTPAQTTNLDGLSAIALAIVVVALMPALSDTINSAPRLALSWMLIAFTANFGLQVIGFRLANNRTDHESATAIGIISGNRNIALFLASLPPEIIAPVLAFIACYQVPMFLTPILMRRLYQTD